MIEYKLSMGAGLEFRSYLSIEYARSVAYKKAVSGGPRTEVYVFRMDKKAIPRMAGYVINQKKGIFWIAEHENRKRTEYVLNKDGSIKRM